MSITKAEVLKDFKQFILPSMLETFNENDLTFKRELWNNYTDQLRQDGIITENQYNNWSNPF